jgi:hypothetical protein
VPYLPEELDVFCPDCRFNLFTMEGNPSCDDPLACDHAKEPLEHVENVRTWTARVSCVSLRQPASPGSSGSRGSGTSRSSGVPGTLGKELAGSSVPMSTRVTFGKSSRAVPAP